MFIRRGPCSSWLPRCRRKVLITVSQPGTAAAIISRASVTVSRLLVAQVAASVGDCDEQRIASLVAPGIPVGGLTLHPTRQLGLGIVQCAVEQLALRGWLRSNFRCAPAR